MEARCRSEEEEEGEEEEGEERREAEKDEIFSLPPKTTRSARAAAPRTHQYLSQRLRRAAAATLEPGLVSEAMAAVW